MPDAVVAPDVFVAWGIIKGPPRTTYKLWQERAVPGFVLEVTSASTRREDQRTKLALYERLGVQEYVLFDPLGEYLRPPLQGYRLVAGGYEPLVPAADGTLTSESPGLELRVEPGSGLMDWPDGTWQLRLYDPRSGGLLPTYEEEGEAREQAEARAAEAMVRVAAEAAREAAATARAASARADEVARLRAELAHLRSREAGAG